MKGETSEKIEETTIGHVIVTINNKKNNIVPITSLLFYSFPFIYLIRY